jgi:hypothetical protein
MNHDALTKFLRNNAPVAPQAPVELEDRIMRSVETQPQHPPQPWLLAPSTRRKVGLSFAGLALTVLVTMPVCSRLSPPGLSDRDLADIDSMIENHWSAVFDEDTDDPTPSNLYRL